MLVFAEVELEVELELEASWLMDSPVGVEGEGKEGTVMVIISFRIIACLTASDSPLWKLR
jgi:hypothetical protein